MKQATDGLSLRINDEIIEHNSLSLKKLSKSAVDYRMSEKGMGHRKCATCKNFNKNFTCDLIHGVINPSALCVKWTS